MVLRVMTGDGSHASEGQQLLRFRGVAAGHGPGAAKHWSIRLRVTIMEEGPL